MIDAIISLIQRTNKFTEQMEMILDVITIKNTGDEQSYLNNTHYPFSIRAMSLPQCNTGFVYMLIPLKPSCGTRVIIGECTSLQMRLSAYNSGYGKYAQDVVDMRPFCLFAYICGFDEDEELCGLVASRWKFLIVCCKSRIK